MNQNRTLDEFIIENQAHYKSTSGEFSRLLGSTFAVTILLSP